MYKTYQLFLTTIVFTGFLMFTDVCAQPAVKIVTDPDIRTIQPGSGPKEIAIIARTDKQNLQFQWILDGPGKIAGDTTSPGILYIPPEKIDGESAQAIIIVIVIDDEKKQAHHSVRFTFRAPGSDPTPAMKNLSHPDTSQEVKEIKTFIDKYLTLSNRGNVSELLKVYADHVNYFAAGVVDQDFIRQDKSTYYKRWEEVRNRLKGDLTIRDTTEKTIKLVIFEIDFRVHSPKREQSISGTARNTLKIQRIDDNWKIIDEQQKILSRKKHTQ